MSKFIQFRRNQANAADKLQLPTEGIIAISAADATSCLILYTANILEQIQHLHLLLELVSLI